MKNLNDLWSYINGHKTIIGTFLLLLFSQDFAQGWFAPDVLTMVQWVIMTVTGASLIHRIKKGGKKKVKK